MYKPRLMDPRRSASVLALFAAIALFVGSSAVAGTGTSVALGAVGFGSIAVDDAGGHVFVSGPRANEVLVFGFDGSLLRTVPNVYGAGAMVVHGGFLYVAEVNTGTIEAIDLSTLTDSGPLATGLNLPTGLAFAGGKLWTAVNGQSGWAQLASVALNGTVTVFSDTSYYEPDFGTSAGDPNTLYVAEDGLSPGAIFRLDVSTGSPVVSSSNTFTDQENIEQVALSPDGSRVIPAAGYPYNFEELSAATLSADGMVYPALPYPSAVAVSPGSGGLLATGLDNGYSSPDISVFRLGAPQAIFTATTTNSSGTANVVPHGLALSADGSRLFAVTADDVSAAEFHLWTFGLNIKMNTTTSVSVAPSPSGFGQPATVTATTSPTDGGGSVAFYANNTPIAGCSAQSVTSGGVATCTTSSLPLGQNPVKAVYSGDAQYLGSSGETTTTVGRGTTTMTASPAQLVKAKNGTYTAVLSATLTAYGSPVAGRTDVFSSAGSQLCSGVTDATGTASCSVVIKTNVSARALQKNGYTATFAGDSQYLASSAQGSVNG
jgi:Bacterial Ig-like domain (group 3)